MKRIARGFGLGTEAFATNVVQSVGPAGSFLAEDHTVENFRRELWMPGPTWTRQGYSAWEDAGRKTMGDRIRCEVERILNTHTVPPLDSALSNEIDRIVGPSSAELGVA